MQRWIALATVIMTLLVGGGWYFRHEYNMKRPDRIWCPVPAEKLDDAGRKKLAAAILEELRKPERLAAVVKDLNLAGKFNLPSDEAAVAELSKRTFAEVGTGNNLMGMTVPTVNIGVDGTRREIELLRQISERQMRDIAPLLGFKEKPAGTF